MSGEWLTRHLSSLLNVAEIILARIVKCADGEVRTDVEDSEILSKASKLLKCHCFFNFSLTPSGL